MTLTKRGNFVAGVLMGALTVGLLWIGQMNADYCAHEAHAKTVRCNMMQP